ncbi:MAG: hypothetical protein A3G18_04600 [Rhodospirillales bacterium RIFCSPLOWO2_12_FULL_58_28]|nr:MAG: hypothetical protein A3H92_09390 [Rhodospirillales bacterium RIFCSPLOWO2_02_FULL_58_16]OHC76922.1 MAG: hypothetical protein A3G18_04600 [Rhodospirillales bacterium RIFCSPLOWO2_12_FULL_58_28]
METSIFRYVLKYSMRQQVILLLMAAISFPFLYMSLDIPKTIVNKAISGAQSGFPKNFFGFELEQIPYLMTLCAAFIVLVSINGAFKYFINIYRSILGERVMRRLRFQLIERVMRFPLHHFRNLSQGEIVALVTVETESLGGFFGDAFSLPAYQGGILLTLIGFMFVQDSTLGMAAIILYPVQGYVIPKLQRKVNALAKERVRTSRKLSERISEMTSGVSEIHAHDTAHYELADFSNRLGVIFNIRNELFRRKFFIKFLNNFLAQLTPFFFFSIGGYLVIDGDLTLGALVAVLAAYKDVSGPWKELLTYYQRMEDNKIKYEQIVNQFEPPGMFDEAHMELRKGPTEPIEGKLVASNLSLELSDGNKAVDGASFSLDTSEHVAIIGSGSGGRSELARMIARQVLPSGGKISVGSKNLTALPNAVIGRLFAYVDQESYIRSGSIMDALLYGLKHYPVDNGSTVADSEDHRKKAEESALSGNSLFDIDAEWVDFEAIGVKNHDELMDRAIEVMRVVDMEDEVFQIALQRIVNADDYPALAEGVLKARAVISEQLKNQGLTGLVEVFDKNLFNSNASVAKNILFGTPVDSTFDIEKMGENPHVLAVLEKVGLTDDFLRIGHSIAGLMVELFMGLAPDHEFFERFSFIDSDDLPDFQRIISQAAADGLKSLEARDQARLIDLPFKMIPARHHLDMIDGPMQKRILDARRVFFETLPEDMRSSIAFFDAETYNPASRIQDNILFGKIVGGKGESAARIGELLAEVIDELGLRKMILKIGLDFDVGIAGKRLSSAQRQKLSIARCLLKRPKLLIYNQAATSLDADSQAAVFNRIKMEMKGNGLIWVDDQNNFTNKFDHVLQVERGKVKETTKTGGVRQLSESETEPAPTGSELDEEAGVLAKIPFFAEMERSQLKLLAFTAERLEFEKNQFLFMQGDTAKVAYMILKGTVDILVDSVEGDRAVATAGKGELIGELALLCDVPRTASVRAGSHVTVLSISKDIFFKYIQENSTVSAGLTRLIAKRLEALMRKVLGTNGMYDERTGLPNRDLLKDRIKFLASANKRIECVSALILINIDDFHTLNEEFSDAQKNEFLIDVARRLKGCLREADTLAYLENSGFGIIANAPAGVPKVDTDIIKKRLAGAMSTPSMIGAKEINLENMVHFHSYPLDEKNLSLALDLL